MKKPDLPRYRPDPTRLTQEGEDALERKRLACIPAHERCRREGLRPIGSISEYDKFILRAGKVKTIQGVRNEIGEQVKELLERRYVGEGKLMQVSYEKGAVLLKSRRRQKEVVSPDDFTYHPFGITFYARDIARLFLYSAKETMELRAASENSFSEPFIAVSQLFI